MLWHGETTVQPHKVKLKNTQPSKEMSFLHGCKGHFCSDMTGEAELISKQDCTVFLSLNHINVQKHNFYL